MAEISYKPPEEITLDDIQGLIDNGVIERKHLEYKRELPKNLKEFLYDTTSLANSGGGIIIYGMNEEGGKPTKADGLADINEELEIRRLEQCLTNGVSPRIIGIQWQPIPVSDKRTIIIQHVPDSWQKPHMVTCDGVNKIYGRNTNNKYLLDVMELRTLFNLSGNTVGRIREFRNERIDKIVTGDAPILLKGQSKIILHVIPLSAFASIEAIDLSNIQDFPYEPIGSDSSQGRYTLEGFIKQRGDHAYHLFHRNGIIETVNAALPASDRSIQQLRLAWAVVNAVRQSFEVLKKTGIQPPIITMLSFTGYKGIVLPEIPNLPDSDYSFDRDIALLPEQVFQKYPEFKEAGKEFRDTLNIVWNTFGYPEFPEQLFDKISQI